MTELLPFLSSIPAKYHALVGLALLASFVGLRAIRARKLAAAALLEKKAAELKADDNPENDLQAAALELEAIEKRADAAALEQIKP